MRNVNCPPSSKEIPQEDEYLSPGRGFNWPPLPEDETLDRLHLLHYTAIRGVVDWSPACNR